MVKPKFQVRKRSWADNEVGGWFGPGASWTLTSFSWLSFIFNIECDNAVAANHDVVGSGEKSAPHKSCPAVTPPAEGASDGNNVSTSSDCASGFLWSQHAVQYKTANLSERGCFQGSIYPFTTGTKVRQLIPAFELTILMRSTTIAGLGGFKGASRIWKSFWESGNPRIHSATAIIISVRIISGTPEPIINFNNRDNKEQFRTIFREGVETLVGSEGDTKARIIRK